MKPEQASIPLAEPRSLMQRLTLMYLRATIVLRVFIVVALAVLYFRARDPLLIVLNVIVLVGLLPSIYVAARAKGKPE